MVVRQITRSYAFARFVGNLGVLKSTPCAPATQLRRLSTTTTSKHPGGNA